MLGWLERWKGPDHRWRVRAFNAYVYTGQQRGSMDTLLCEFGRPHALPQTGNMLPCSRPCNNNLCCCPHTDPSHCQATTLYICSVGLVAASPHTYHPTTFQSPPLQRLLYFPAAAFPAAALSLKLAIRGALGLGAYSSAFALSRTVSNFLFARRATLAGRCCAAYASPCHPPCPASER